MIALDFCNSRTIFNWTLILILISTYSLYSQESFNKNYRLNNRTWVDESSGNHMNMRGKKWKANVLLTKDTLYANIWKTRTETILYYKMSNRRYIRLPFQEISISGITIPLKYRLKNKDKTAIVDGESIFLQEEFSTGININAFVGYTFGWTTFLYRKHVGNREIVNKITLGGLLGTSTVELNSSNTNLAGDDALNETIKKGLLSTGFGVVYVRNKFNLGIFLGWDYAVGDSANLWNYNKEPWLGFAIGFSVLDIKS